MSHLVKDSEEGRRYKQKKARNINIKGHRYTYADTHLCTQPTTDTETRYYLIITTDGMLIGHAKRIYIYITSTEFVQCDLLIRINIYYYYKYP